jgi:hypothetical protein
MEAEFTFLGFVGVELWTFAHRCFQFLFSVNTLSSSLTLSLRPGKLFSQLIYLFILFDFLFYFFN